jgi:hypothetical protein
MAKTYRIYNGPMPTTGSPAKVATGAVIKTLLQIATPSTSAMRVTAWGISFDGSAAATPGTVELVQTDVAATVTAAVANDLYKYNDPNAPASLMALGAAATGYTASAEGTITNTRELDTQLIAPTGQYVYQMPLGRESEVPVSKFLRIRVNFPVTVNALCWIEWEE